MCTPEAAFAAALISAGATVQQGRIQQRNIENQEAVARFQAQAQITELEENKKLNEIKAKEEERERRRILEADLSAITAFNRGLESTSKSNIRSTSEDLFGADVATNRFNVAVANQRIDRQIGVLNVQKDMPSVAGGVLAGSYVSAFAQATSGYANYRLTKLPSSRPSISTTSTTPTSYSPSSPSFGYAQRNLK